MERGFLKTDLSSGFLDCPACIVLRHVTLNLGIPAGDYKTFIKQGPVSGMRPARSPCAACGLSPFPETTQ